MKNNVFLKMAFVLTLVFVIGIFGKLATAETVSSPQLIRVKPSQVNMATNRYGQAEQEELTINGRTYYVTGEGFRKYMSQFNLICNAKDPFTRNMVDKAKAVTYADPLTGKVYYFESEETYASFVDPSNQEAMNRYMELR